MSHNMIFLTNRNSKPKIIKHGQELLENKKSSLEKLYCVNRYPKKEEEITQFIIDLIEKSENLLNKNNNIDDTFNISKNLIQAFDQFSQKNNEFLDKSCLNLIGNIVYMSVGIAIVLAGMLQIEKSHVIENQFNAIKLAYDGTDRIAVSIEKYGDFIPKPILLDIKEILVNILENAEKNYTENIEYFQDKEQNRVFFLNNFVSMKRVCNSTIFLIDKHLQKREIIDLYPNKKSFDYIKKQQEKFNNIDKILLEKYKGQFIYFENGKILDSDFAEEKLIQRVMEKVGYRSVFITKV